MDTHQAATMANSSKKVIYTRGNPVAYASYVPDDDLNILTANSLISRGPLVFILMMMLIVGVVVNTIVIAVFLKRFPASAIRTYIVTMSVSDFVATGVAIPLHIYTVMNAYNVSDRGLCRAHFFLCSLSTNCSSFVIVLLAWDRYRRIRNPVYAELDKVRSYYMAALAVFLAVLVTAPFAPLYGVAQVPTGLAFNLQARMCWLDHEHEGTLYPEVYIVVVGLTFSVGMTIMCYSYGMIGSSIFQLAKDISEEVEYRLAHPLPPSSLPDIYAEDEPEPAPSTPKEDLDPHEPLAFAARLHLPREGEVAGLSPNMVGGKKMSRIKKISNAIQNIFAPMPPSPPSSSDSSFVSERANTTVVAKTMLSPRGSMGKPQCVQKVSLARQAKLSIPNVYVVNTDSGTSADTASLKEKPKVITKPPNQPSAHTDPETSQSSLATTDVTTDLTIAATSIKPELPPPLPQPQVVISPAPIIPVTTTTAAVPDSRTVSPGTKDKTPSPLSVKIEPEVKEPPPALYTLQRTRSEELATLAHLDRIKNRSTTMMCTLTTLYFLTWLPNFLSRLISRRPANYCPGFQECWMNGPAYFVCSVYINSTVNAFFYCFGSVHFRKQVNLFFKPCQDKFCRPRRRKVIRVVRRRKKTQQSQKKMAKPKQGDQDQQLEVADSAKLSTTHRLKVAPSANVDPKTSDTSPHGTRL